MYSKILLYGAVGRVHSGLRESNQEDENKKGLGSVFFSFDLSFFGSKAKQAPGASLRILNPLPDLQGIGTGCGNEIQFDL